VVATRHLDIKPIEKLLILTVKIDDSMRPLSALRIRLGVVVVDMADGGPADAAGVRVQDIVTSVDGKPTSVPLPLLAMRLRTHHIRSRDARHPSRRF